MCRSTQSEPVGPSSFLFPSPHVRVRPLSLSLPPSRGPQPQPQLATRDRPPSLLLSFSPTIPRRQSTAVKRGRVNVERWGRTASQRERESNQRVDASRQPIWVSWGLARSSPRSKTEEERRWNAEFHEVDPVKVPRGTPYGRKDKTGEGERRSSQIRLDSQQEPERST